VRSVVVVAVNQVEVLGCFIPDDPPPTQRAAHDYHNSDSPRCHGPERARRTVTLSKFCSERNHGVSRAHLTPCAARTGDGGRAVVVAVAPSGMTGQGNPRWAYELGDG